MPIRTSTASQVVFVQFCAILQYSTKPSTVRYNIPTDYCSVRQHLVNSLKNAQIRSRKSQPRSAQPSLPPSTLLSLRNPRLPIFQTYFSSHPLPLIRVIYLSHFGCPWIGGGACRHRSKRVGGLKHGQICPPTPNNHVTTLYPPNPHPSTRSHVVPPPCDCFSENHMTSPNLCKL